LTKKLIKKDRIHAGSRTFLILI